MSVTEDSSQTSRIAADQDKLCVWVMPCGGSADRVFLMPLARALYKNRNPLYNFSMGEMLDSFPKLGSWAPDAQKIFGKYVRRFMRRQGIDAIVGFGLNHLMAQEGEQKINLYEEAGIPHYSLFISDPRELCAEDESFDRLLSHEHWTPVLLDPALHEELSAEFPEQEWHYLAPAVDLEAYRPVETAGREPEDVQFRVAVIAEMLDPVVELVQSLNEDEVGIWDGQEWAESGEFSDVFYGSSLEDTQLNLIYNLAELIVHTDELAPISTQRALNALASGGFPLGYHHTQLEDMLKVELPFIDRESDIRPVVRKWRERSSDRREIVREGAEQIRREHSWEQRTPDLLEILGVPEQV